MFLLDHRRLELAAGRYNNVKVMLIFPDQFCRWMKHG